MHMKTRTAVEEDIQVARDKILVGWNIKFIEDKEESTIRPQVMVTFSHERAATQMGEKQGAHTSAHALGVMLVMQILRNFIPVENDQFAGITNLTDEMQIVKERDVFLLDQFGIVYPASQLLDGLYDEVKAQKELANDTIKALRKAVNAVRGYSNLPTDGLKATTKEAKTVLSDLGGIDIRLLDSQKLSVRRDYCMRVSTLSAEQLLEYLNKAPFATFERIKAKDKEEEDYEKGEGARVRKALAYLQAYAVSPVEVVVNVQVAEVDAESLRRARPRAAKAAAAKAAQERRLAEEAEKIVEAMYDLLYYPLVPEDYSIAAVKEGVTTKRTNDLGALCFVVARHIATIFATFDGLEGRADKEDIVSAYIDRMLDDWDVAAKDRKGIITNITKALGKWEVEKENVHRVMEERRALAALNVSGISLLEPSPDRGGQALDTGLASASVVTPDRRSSGLFTAFRSPMKSLSGRFSSAQKEQPPVPGQGAAVQAPLDSGSSTPHKGSKPGLKNNKT